MMADMKKFYIVKYSPDGKGAPYFFDKHFEPDLPEYDMFNVPPNPGAFEKNYKLRALTSEISADFLPDDNMVSKAVLNVCEELGVNFLARPLDVTLSKKKKSVKEYFLFFLQDYISILDRASSVYKEGQDFSQVDDQERKFPERHFYDKIDHFVVQGSIIKDLFWCLDVSQPVCSDVFKRNFLELGLAGIEFVPIDSNYIYDPWGDF